MRRVARIGLLVGTVLLAVAPEALAAGPKSDAYGGSGGQAQGVLNQAGSGTLPFTGLNLLLVVVVALGLVAVGIVLRRQAARGR